MVKLGEAKRVPEIEFNQANLAGFLGFLTLDNLAELFGQNPAKFLPFFLLRFFWPHGIFSFLY